MLKKEQLVLSSLLAVLVLREHRYPHRIGLRFKRARSVGARINLGDEKSIALKMALHKRQTATPRQLTLWTRPPGVDSLHISFVPLALENNNKQIPWHFIANCQGSAGDE